MSPEDVVDSHDFTLNFLDEFYCKVCVFMVLCSWSWFSFLCSWFRFCDCRGFWFFDVIYCKSKQTKRNVNKNQLASAENRSSETLSYVLLHSAN